jgi:hypothetical protein
MMSKTFGIIAAALVAFAIVSFYLLSPASISVGAEHTTALEIRASYANALMAGASLSTLLVALFAGFYAKLASDEARRQADIAGNALVSSERAWLKVDLQIVGPFQWHKFGGPSVEVGINIENIGRTPALNVHTNVVMLANFGAATECCDVSQLWCGYRAAQGSRI